MNDRRSSRQVIRALLAVLLGTSVLLAVPGPAAAAAPPAMSYVVLGDSYSSGVGTGRYDVAGAPCLRSSVAYGPLWAKEHSARRTTFLACSGARLYDVLTKQVPKIPHDADLVTLTIGGNDAGFGSVLGACTSVIRDHTCSPAVQLGRKAISAVPVQLATTLAVIRVVAPKARIIVLGYPHLFELGPCSASAPSERDRAQLNAAADLLNDHLAKGTVTAGARFVDVRQRFAGHGVCAPADRTFLNGPGQGAESYHPNRDGYAKGYLAALDHAVTDLDRS